MKKLKFLPSVLMMIACIAVLVIGVYSATPIESVLRGTINISASKADAAITIYLGDVSDNVVLTERTVIRDSQEIMLDDSKLAFNIANAENLSDVESKTISIKVENLYTSKALGVHFVAGKILSSGTTSANVATVKHLDGTMGSGESATTVKDIVTAKFSPYTKVTESSSNVVTCELSLNSLENAESVAVELALALNIEEYNEQLAPLTAGINVNTNANAVVVTTKVAHGYTAGATLSNTYTNRISTSYLRIDNTKYANTNIDTSVKRYRTTEVTFSVANAGEKAVTVDIDAVLDDANIQVTTLGNAYIGAGKTGEVSLQFTPLRDSVDTIITSTIKNVLCNINVYEATEQTELQASIKDRMRYNALGYNWGTMKHYIEYGDNPFKAGQKLKWYVWGVSVDNGALRVLTADDVEVSYDANGNQIEVLKYTSTENGTREYYFISENILDVNGAGRPYLMYNGEYDDNSYYSADGTDTNKYYASNYEGSLVQGYLSGTTMRTNYTSVNSGHISTGVTANFYDYYGLTNDPIYNQINARSIKEMCTSQYDNSYNSKYDGMADKFWSLSYSEYLNFLGRYSANSVAKLLSTSSVAYWRLRSPYGSNYVYYVCDDGNNSLNFVYYDNVGIRPAFKLAI